MRFLKVGFILFIVLILISSLYLKFGVIGFGVERSEYFCGDNICTIPYEDSIICSEDCEKNTSVSGLIIAMIVVAVFFIFMYFNFYRGKADLRRVSTKNPFRSVADIEKIMYYIDLSLKRGKKKSEIAKALQNKGWKKKQIIYAFDEYFWRTRKVLLETAPKRNIDLWQVEDYIRKCLSFGLSPAAIQSKLLAKGWKKDKVRKAFRNAKKER